MIKLTENSELDMKSLEIKDIIDISLLQKFQDDFAFAMNCASVTVDREGNPVTNPAVIQDFVIDLFIQLKKVMTDVQLLINEWVKKLQGRENPL